MNPMTQCPNGHVLPGPYKPCPACHHDAMMEIEYFAPENRRNRGKRMNLPKVLRRLI